MNRCSQVIADACTSMLARLVQKSKPIQIDHLTFNASMKNLILTDPAISINITDEAQFEVYESSGGMPVPDGPAISTARLSDFFLGASRVRKQYDNVLKIKESCGNSAWMLVSAYYCAYFASVELSKLFGKINMSFDRSDVELVRSKAAGVACAQFFENRKTNFSGAEFAGKIIFRSVGDRPHVAAWQNMRKVLRPLFQDYAWLDASLYMQLISDDDYSPSEIRNAWNYKRADYFGMAGEIKAAEFKKLVGNPAGAHAWLIRRSGRIDPLDPCIVAVLCEALAPAVIEASKKAGNIVRQVAD